MKIYKVGGCVRDKLMGINSKDIDFTVVINDLSKSPEEGFEEMTQHLQTEGFEIFLSTPEMFTIRAKFPVGHVHERTVGDFVLARKENGYVEGTRRPILTLGTLYDDLFRRDFTLNALAEDEDGSIIDYFNGAEDLKKLQLRTPNTDTQKTLNDDPLRVLRALRFHVTRGFQFHYMLEVEIGLYDMEKMKVVSEERIREELYKMFKHDTLKTLRLFNRFSHLRDYIFKNTNLWLKPTNES